MNETHAIILLAAALCGILVWLLIKGENSSGRGASSPHPNGVESLPEAKHYAYFPQIRQALSASDRGYLVRNAPSRVARRALRERRAVARRFLGGLRDDFSNLARLGRTIALLSPEVSHQQEAERLILGAKFQLLYALVWLRLSVGLLPLHQLETLAGLVGRLATRIDEAMAEINALSAGQMAGKLNV